MSDGMVRGISWPELDERGVEVQNIMPSNPGFDQSHSVLEVPMELQTLYDVETSVRDAPADFWKDENPVLSYCRAELLDESICHDAVRSDARNLKYVPPSLLDRETCIVALVQDGNLLCEVPPALVDRDLCMTAVKRSPSALRYVPEDVIDRELCEAALSVAGVGLQIVPEELRDKEMCLLALSRIAYWLGMVSSFSTRRKAERAFIDVFHAVPSAVMDREICELVARTMPSLLAEMPEEVIDESVYLAAIGSPRFRNTSGDTLKLVPKSLLTSRFIDQALESCGMCLAGLDGRRRTKARCEKAVYSSPMALEYVPPRLVTPELCQHAVESDPHALRFVPEAMLTADMCEAAVRQDWKLACYVPSGLLDSKTLVTVFEEALVEYSLADELGIAKGWALRVAFDTCERLQPPVSCDRRIRFLARRLGLRELTSCAFDSVQGCFIIRERVIDGWKGVEKHYGETVVKRRSLTALSSYLMSDYADAYIGQYSLSERERKSIGTTNVTSYSLWEMATDGIETSTLGERTSETILAEPGVDLIQGRDGVTVFYVTDIHLSHRIKARFPSRASDHDVRALFRELVRSLAEKRDSVVSHGSDSVLLIGGDISDSFTLSSLFFKELAEVWKPSRIYVVLGNHELWDAPVNLQGGEAVDWVVNRYRELLSRLGMTLLHNEMAMLWRERDDVRIGAEEIMDPSRERSLLDATQSADMLLFGGIGFSALSPDYDYKSMIYRHVIRSSDQEAEQSAAVDGLHARLAELFDKRLVVFLTHMPIWCWSEQAPNRGWAYVSGHTHHNGLDVWERGGHYHDAQVGYAFDGMLLGHFLVPGVRDIFWHYGDGAYRITHAQYREFNRCMGIRCDFTRQGELLMLKRGGYYLYLLRCDGKTYRLEGGKTRKLGTWDAGTMYESLALYAGASKAIFAGYRAALERIADEVRSIGGVGTVHGAIVDVDFYNHVYVDPIDGGVSYYFATSSSAKDRVEYRNMRSLLKARRPELLQAYEQESMERGDAISSVADELAMVRRFDNAVVKTTYARSRIARSFQYLFDTNVVRTWDEGILETLSQIVSRADAVGDSSTVGPSLPSGGDGLHQLASRTNASDTHILRQDA